MRHTAGSPANAQHGLNIARGQRLAQGAGADHAGSTEDNELIGAPLQ
jgi:hypothetical protein